MQEHRSCEACATAFIPTPRSHGQKYCGRRCRERGSGRTVRQKPCSACGELFEYTHDNRKKTRCDGCKPKAKAKPTTCDVRLASCLRCHEPFVIHRKDTKAHNPRCRSLIDYGYRYKPLPPGECETCGGPVAERRGGGCHCSKGCRRQSPSYRAARKREKRKRRARKRGVVSERYEPQEIYERDGWCCGLCGDRLDRAAVVPDYNAPTIDHIVPLARGGDDTRANVQAAHFICNARKGDRGGNEQLRLIG